MPASLADWATLSCHSRTRVAIAASSPRDITRDLPVSTSNASTHPAETPRQLECKRGVDQIEKHVVARVQVRQLAQQAVDVVEQEIGDHRHERGLAHEPGKRSGWSLALLHVLQPAAVLIGVETVNHLVLANARPDRRQLRRNRRRRSSARTCPGRTRRTCRSSRGARDRRRDRHAVDAAPRRQRPVGHDHDVRRARLLELADDERAEVGQRGLRPVDRREAIARLPSRAARRNRTRCRESRLRARRW